MSVRFRRGKFISPSGFGLALSNVPSINPEQNISLIDRSYEWSENIANVDSSVIESYINQDGQLQSISVTDFLVTNVTSTSTTDIDAEPLYYKHQCRFCHYTYGENPIKDIYVLDQSENILKSINYLIKATRVIKNVYRIDILTDFKNNEYVQYKVKYNRCLQDGTAISPSWTEIMNMEDLFINGSPTVQMYEYSITGPDTNGEYTCTIPPVPTLTELINSVGTSFETAPTFIDYQVANTAAYDSVGVRYTLKATNATLFTIQRNKDRETGAVSSDYLTSAITEGWGTATNFSIGTVITSIPGVTIRVNADNYLKANDEAYFTASRSYYFLKPTAYRSIYAGKPIRLGADDDWYLRIKDGSFKRRMDGEGTVVPSGQGVLYEYAIPEYDNEIYDTDLGKPYRESFDERAEIMDIHNVRVRYTPIYIPASSVHWDNVDSSGYPTTDYLTVSINEDDIEQSNIVDWDAYNGVIKLSDNLSNQDDVSVTYHYEEDFYQYRGFSPSGTPFMGIDPFEFLELDLNPTPFHNHGFFASGVVAHIFTKPYRNVDSSGVINSEVLYHNFTGRINPPEENLLVHYKLDDDKSDTVVVDSVGSYNGTASNPTRELSFLGHIDKAFNFNGIDQYVSAAASISAPECFTCWVNAAELPATTAVVYHIVFGKDAGIVNGINIQYTAGGTVTIAGINGYFTDDAAATSIVNYAIIKGSWYHIVWQYESDMRGHLYVNGIHVGQGNVTSGTLQNTSAQTFKIGGGVATRYSAAIIDDCRAYSEPLTLAQITDLYNSKSDYDFELASVSVGPICKKEDIELTDIRVRGGGLNDRGIAEIEDVKSVQPEAEFLWDTGYFDGQAVPANGALVVSVPRTVLETNGGSFTEDEVRQKILKHMGYGIYPIITYL